MAQPNFRNLRSLHAFFRYFQAEEPAHMLQCPKILAIHLSLASSKHRILPAE